MANPLAVTQTAGTVVQSAQSVPWVVHEQRTVTATVTSVALSTTTATILAENSARLAAIIHNDSVSVLYVKFGTNASPNFYTYKLFPDSTLEVPVWWAGTITGVLASGTGTARVTEA